MTRSIILSLFAGMCLMLWAPNAEAQDNADTYTEGTVWQVSMIRTHANLHDDYLKRLKNTWGSTMKKAKAEGLILNYKILSGAASNDDDYNLLLMVEFKSMGTMDPNPDRDAKWDAIEKAVREGMGSMEFDNTVKEYGDIRDFQGQKLMRELSFK